MDEQQARRELRTALKARRRQQLLGTAVLALLVAVGVVVSVVSIATQRRFSPEQLLPVIYGALAYLAWHLGLRPVDTSGALVRCRIVHPYGMGGRGLRIRRPDGAILAVALADDKGATVNEGDEAWFLDPREGRRLLGVRWNPILRRGEVIAGQTRARLVMPPGAVPRALAASDPHADVQDALPGSTAHGRPPGAALPPRTPIAIRPLGPPPPEPPDGIDENQARAALAAPRPGRSGRLARAARAASAPDVPLEIVTIASTPPAGLGRRPGELAVRRAGGDRYAWVTALERWPATGSTAWATRVTDDVEVRLVVPTAAGDVILIEPHGPARRAEEPRG